MTICKIRFKNIRSKNISFKNLLLKKLPAIFLALLVPVLFSCESLPVNYSLSETWFMGGNSQKIRGSISLAGVSVDRTGGWDSLEKEISALAPAYFWKGKYRMVGKNENPNYLAEITAREREYNLGWRSKRSLSVEITIRAAGNEQDRAAPSLPLALGRVVAIGDRSFSSSQTTGKLLSRAIQKTLKQLRSTH